MCVAVPFETLWINEFLALSLIYLNAANIFTPEDKMTGGSHLDVNTSALVGVWSLGGKQSKCKLRMVDDFFVF